MEKKPKHVMFPKKGEKMAGNPMLPADISRHATAVIKSPDGGKKFFDFNVDDLFVPDSLALYEFNSAKVRRENFEPEKQLMLAILDDAVFCFQKYLKSSTRSGRKLFAEADEWFQQRGSNWLFSFENVCSYLRLDADYVRNSLNRWKEEAQKSNAVALEVRKRGRMIRCQTPEEESNAASA